MSEEKASGQDENNVDEQQVRLLEKLKKDRTCGVNDWGPLELSANGRCKRCEKWR